MQRRRRDEEFWARVRSGLEGARGPAYWQSLAQLADSEEFRRDLEAEFPAMAPLMTGASRRDVLRVMGASLALGGLAGCDVAPPQEPALPYVNAPEFMVPGEPRYYATATLLGGYAFPVLVETHMARPIKVEGNPEHPASRGATDVFAQAAVLDLYDPDRSDVVTYGGRIMSWNACQLALVERASALADRRGEGLAILTGAVTSPTTVRLVDRVRERLPELRRYVHEPLGKERRYEAARLAFGQVLDIHYRLDEADVVVSLEDDFLGPGPAQVPQARHWIEHRRRKVEDGELPRLYVLESTPTLTGGRATEATPASSAEVINVVIALAQAFGLGPGDAPDLPLPLRARAQTMVEELQSAGERALVAPGPHLPPEVQALAFAINGELGAIGRTVAVSDPIEATADAADQGLAALVDDIDAGAVDTLLILDSNPVYTGPADVDIQAALEQVPFRLHIGPYRDETAALCHWHVPLAHPFEAWGDARAVDGTASVIQPLIRPLFGGRTTHEVLATLAGEPDLAPREAVRTTWRDILGADDFENAWRQVLHDGFAPETGAELRRARVHDVPSVEPAARTEQLEAVVRADPTVWDGRYANNGWLQELPKPFSKVTWDNVVFVSPELAEARRLRDGDLVDLSGGDRRVRAPVHVMPGQAAHALTLFLGYGRERVGRVGDFIGYNAYRLRTTSEPWRIENVILHAADEETTLATTQHHHTLAGHHHLIRELTIEELQEGHSVEHHEGPRPSLYPKWEYESYAWAMAIDLDACIGCNACVVACQAENNVPVVGKEQVAMGREMHWLRIDHYHSGPIENPRTHWQPVPCMHCENAPCEVGCPVNATVHGPEGLNQMIYNRCVGTRTCASYCPYKVRRFNFHDYTDAEAEAVSARRNPDVTVRARGVMEKCTYCVQRISAARIEAKKENHSIPDGAVQTACQQACPTRAIVFGDGNDADTLVSRLKASPRNYALLGELNTRPRTTYLAGIRPAHHGSTQKPEEA